MARRVGNGRIGVALAAAFLLFLQGVLGAVANAASLAGPVDPFGHSLCLSTDGEGGHPSGHDPAAMPECCTLACMAGTPWLPPVADAQTAPVLRLSLLVDGPPQKARVLGSRDDYHPGRPRAPPLRG